MGERIPTVAPFPRNDIRQATAKGTAVFTLSKLFAIDANEAYTEAVTYSIAPGTGRNQAIITITLSEEFLTAEDRVFPVIVDPTLTIQSYETADASICSNFPDTNYQMAYNLRTGYEPDYGTRRSFIKFNIPSSVSGKRIQAASLQLEHLSGVAPTVRAYRVQSSWSSGSITWRSRPTYTSTDRSPTATRNSTTNWFQMNVTAIVQGWVTSAYSNYGFMIMDITEDDGDHWSTFYSSDAESARRPKLYISYSTNDYSGGNEGGGGEDPDPPAPSTPPEPSTPPPVPDYRLQLNYDNAYVSRCNSESTSAPNRIIGYAQALQDKYLQELDIYVTYSTPALVASHADSCTHSHLEACECLEQEGNEDLQCTNGGRILIDVNTYIPDTTVYHHNNYMTNAYNISPPDSPYNFRAFFNGHILCKQLTLQESAYVEEDEHDDGHMSDYRKICKGRADKDTGVLIVTNNVSTTWEKATFIHEFGHFLGVIDHYPGKIWETKDLNAHFETELFQDACIYGAEHQVENGNTMVNVVICEGCKKILKGEWVAPPEN